MKEGKKKEKTNRDPCDPIQIRHAQERACGEVQKMLNQEKTKRKTEKEGNFIRKKLGRLRK